MPTPLSSIIHLIWRDFQSYGMLLSKLVYYYYPGFTFIIIRNLVWVHVLFVCILSCLCIIILLCILVILYIYIYNVNWKGKSPSTCFHWDFILQPRGREVDYHYYHIRLWRNLIIFRKWVGCLKVELVIYFGLCMAVDLE